MVGLFNGCHRSLVVVVFYSYRVKIYYIKHFKIATYKIISIYIEYTKLPNKKSVLVKAQKYLNNTTKKKNLAILLNLTLFDLTVPL